MAHCPNCSPQPRNEQHTIDRLQNTVEPLLYTRNFMLAKYFKMECECMRCQAFISSIPNMERPREDLRTPKHHTPTSSLLLSILILLLLIVQKTSMFYCHPKLTFKYLSTTQTQQNLCASWLSDL